MIHLQAPLYTSYQEKSEILWLQLHTLWQVQRAKVLIVDRHIPVSTATDRSTVFLGVDYRQELDGVAVSKYTRSDGVCPTIRHHCGRSSGY